MRRTFLLLAVCVIVGPASIARAQAPAAFADGKKAYEAGQFEKARDLFLSASRTAPKNAEVFLHLGKAHYQLGELPEAIAAWQRTLRLAPGEPYAAKMLKLLRGETRDVDVQIELIEQALQEGMNTWVRNTVEALLAKRSLTDAQRGKLMVLRAEVLLAMGLHKLVPPVVLEIQTKHPKAAGAVRLALLMGRAKIHLDDRSILAGQGILQGILADQKGTPEAVIAQYELIRFDLGQAPSVASVGRLTAWFKANGEHRLATEALRLLIDSYLALTRRGPRPSPDSPLAPTDTAAIGYVKLLRDRLPKEADRLKLIEQMERHFNAHYDPAGAYAAAIEGEEALLKLALSRAENKLLIQRIIDRHLAVSRTGERPTKDMKLAAADLAAIARAGDLLALLTTDAEVRKLMTQLLGHLASRYAAAGAHPAVIQAAEALRKHKLPRAAEVAVLEQLVGSHLAITQQQPSPARDAKVTPADLAAVARAKELLALLTTEAEVQKVMQQLLGHFNSHYFAAGAHAAAIQGTEGLLQIAPSQAARVAALRQLVDLHLAITRQQPGPMKDAKLSATDLTAIARLRELFALLPKDADRQQLAQQLLGHLGTHYAKAGAYAAAVQGAQAVLQLPLPRGDRHAALRTLASYKTELAIRQLGEQAAAGALPAQMPASIREILALYDTADKEFPGKVTWSERVALAGRVAGLAAKLPPAVKVTALSAPDAWSVDIALAVVQGDKTTAAGRAAVSLVDSVRKRYLSIPAPVGLRISLDLTTRFPPALGEESIHWTPTRLEHARVLGLLATWQFSENIRLGRDELNAKLSDTQKQMIAVLIEQVKRDVRGQAAQAVSTLAAHLKPWEARGHYAVAEEAYALLIDSLPAARQREVRLAVAELWVRQVIAEHQRLMAAGLQVPAELHPTFVKALKRCYELQAGLDEADAFGKKVRAVAQIVVNHYRSLEYYDTATAAIRVKSDKPVPVADRCAQLALADDLYARAQRELAVLLRQYNAKTKITLTAAFKAALAAYRTFISQHSTSPLADTAVKSVFSIAQMFASHEAHPIAAAVYDEFAKFAAKINTLSQAAPGQVSVADRAALAHAAALDAHARKLLAKWLAERKDKAPPAKILPEFTTAIGAYKQFVQDRPRSVLVGSAIQKIMAVALEYAKTDAWDVAEGIFADLAQSKLKLDSPERIELSRGLCHLGKVMPDHARSVLTALTRGHGRPKRPGGQARLALGYAEEPSEAGAAVAGRKRAGKPAGGPTPKPPPATRPPSPTGADGRTTFRADRLEAEDLVRDEADVLAMAAIRKQQSARARQVAMLREKLTYNQPAAKTKDQKAQKRTATVPAPPVLSEAELARQEKAFDAAYTIFQAIRKNFPRRSAAEQARGEILVMAGHWRAIGQWTRAAGLTGRYLNDNPTDRQLPQLRLGIARDILSWAARPITKEATKRAKLAEVTQRFTRARAELERIVKDFAEDRSLVQQAQWDIANSFLTQARVVDQFSPTLARGQYVRAARELRAVAEKFHDHPKISTIPQMLWNIAEELARRKYYDEAMIVWNDLTIHYLTHPLAQQAALRTAQTYESNLGRPLKAAETYLEINFARGGSDTSIQNAIYNIGSRLKGQKRWVEALHVLETFVDSFPRHGQAGQALTTIGQIHQVNEAWEDAIAAYQRVIEEFPAGNWVREAKWSIADCRINLSQWRQAMEAYRAYVQAYAKDSRAAEATRRMSIMKDLARYQVLVDEKGQRKAFDAQFQIARIVQEQLANRAKAIIEYRKVTANWPKTHLADDALFAVGNIYLSMNETARGREALLELARAYPESPLADDALYKVGQSYEAEAQQLAGVTRGKAVERNKLIAQRDAYRQVQGARGRMRRDNDALVAALRRQGQQAKADVAQARFAGQLLQFNLANTMVAAQAAERQVEVLTAAQLADRQDKINAALRQAVSSYQNAARVATADKADEALLQMARIYDEKLKDADAAMATWQEIVRQFSGTAVAEDASWRIAQFHERKGQYAQAIQAYQAFLRNYRPSTRAAAAQFAVAESYEHLGEWVKAMDAYTNYINNFPKAPMVQKAREQIAWIKTYRL